MARQNLRDVGGGGRDRLPKSSPAAMKKKVLVLALVIAGYFATSLGLTFFQKRLISRLRFPITIVACHLVLKFLFAGACRGIYTQCTGKERVVLSWSNYLSRVALVAVFSALDIGLSQWSFEFITVSLYTMTKTTAVLFVLMFAILFKLEKKHWTLIVIVSMISVGLFLFVFKSTSFSLVGFAMVLSASFLSGARWTLSQLIMQKGKLGLANPVDLIFHIQPIMVITILPFAAGFEGVGFAASSQAFRYGDFSVVLHTASLILFGGVLAFVMETAEFFIVTKASSLTLSIVGITKEIVTIMLDVYINNSELSPINVAGAAICLCGIGLHIYRKATVQKSAASDLVTGRSKRGPGNNAASEFSMPLLSDSEFSSDEEELFNNSSKSSNGSGFREFDDEFYLRDNREWTSVRDSQLQLKRLAEDENVATATLIGAPSVLLAKSPGDDEDGAKSPAEPVAFSLGDLLSD